MGCATYRECQSRFRRNASFHLAGRCGDTGPCACSSDASNGCAFTAARKSADQGSSGSSAADLDYVALGVALALEEFRGRRYRMTIDGGEPDRKLAGSVKTSAGFRTGDSALHGRARTRNGLAVYDDILRERAFKSLSGG